MKITIESTSKIVELVMREQDDRGLHVRIPARVWEGQTEDGQPVIVFVTRIMTPAAVDQIKFQQDLAECKEPSAEVQALPLRLIL